jgi:hypothetical protein
MKVVKVQHRRLAEYALLLATLLLSSSICFFATPAKAQTEEATIKIINPLSSDNKFTFNSTDYPVNSTFTADIYVVNVTKLTGWQIYISWNNTIINSPKGWMPDDNAFALAVNQGANIIAPQPFVEVIGGIGYLKYGAALIAIRPDAPLTVDAPGQALLCKINFTIAASPEDSQIFTNIELIRQEEQQSSLDSYVAIRDTPTSKARKAPIFAEPALVRIVKATFQSITDVAIVSFTADPLGLEAGDSTNIIVGMQNIGNNLEMFNVTIKNGQTLLATIRWTLGAYQNATYKYPWNSSDLRLDIPLTVTIFGVPIVVKYQAQPLISADVILPGDINQTNNHAEVKLTVESKYAGLDYLRWLILIWLGTSLGQLLLGYTIIFVGFLTTLSVYRRFRSPKSPRPQRSK